jgi:DNA-binding LacI/PurR family transcriptional regulator/biotin operon repressor
MDKKPIQTAVIRPACIVARKLLDETIARHLQMGDLRLPALEALASAAGVSRMTMWRVLGELRNQGRIQSGRGRGIALVATSQPTVKAQTPVRAHLPWERVTSALRQELLQGTLHPGGVLPPVKELTRVHGVCHQTVRKALALLAEEGMLQPFGRRMRAVEAPSLLRARSDVFLIAFGQAGQPRLSTPRSQEHVRALEQECSRLGVRLRIVTQDMILDRRQGREALLDQFRETRPLGVVLWRIVLTGEAFRRTADLVAASGLPCAVLDETGDAADLLPKHRALPWRVFSMAVSTTAGRDVGRYLVRLGHQRVAFVSAATGSTHFAALRLAGLRQAFAEAGLAPQTITAFTIPQPQGLAQLAAMNRHMQATLDLFADAVAQGGPRRHVFIDAAEQLIEQLRRPDAEATGHARAADALASLLKQEEPTAWVGENDPLALDCLNFLQERGVDVPGRLSMVGFDDGMTSMMRGMTSYNFGGDNVTRAMLAFLLRPERRPRAGTPPQVVELPGRVVERRTTGPVPRA